MPPECPSVRLRGELCGCAGRGAHNQRARTLSGAHLARRATATQLAHKPAHGPPDKRPAERGARVCFLNRRQTGRQLGPRSPSERDKFPRLVGPRHAHATPHQTDRQTDRQSHARTHAHRGAPPILDSPSSGPDTASSLRQLEALFQAKRGQSDSERRATWKRQHRTTIDKLPEEGPTQRGDARRPAPSDEQRHERKPENSSAQPGE